MKSELFARALSLSAESYQLHPGGNSSLCVRADSFVVNPSEFVVRLDSCSPPSDYGEWQFVSDNDGHYFAYNKGYNDTTQRLDFVRSNSLDVLIMGPSGDEYNNQRWQVEVSNHLGPERR
jgi:hypothetical protein